MIIDLAGKNPMKQLLLILTAACWTWLCVPASALPVAKLTSVTAGDGPILVHGHHYGWYGGRGHHYGWWRGRHRGW